MGTACTKYRDDETVTVPKRMVNSHHPFEGNGELAHELGFDHPNHKLRDQLDEVASGKHVELP